jgi:hypothetical protein
MKHGLGFLALAGWFLTAGLAIGADEKPKRTPKEALKAFNDLIGTWKGTGIPEGSREVQQRDFWTEKLMWQWQFQDGNAWLRLDIDKGKHFTKGELRYLPDKDKFQLTLRTPANESLTFEGAYKEKEHLLSVERTDDKTKESQRLVISLLHANRILYRFEVKPEKRTAFAKKFQVGATKEGVAFASGDGQPECVVSGGLGTIKVMHKGKTYYVCCTGCRDAFKDDPERYIKEFEERKKAKEKDKDK